MKHFPPKIKYKKKFRKTLVFRNRTINQSLEYGNYGIQLLEYGKIQSKQLEALQRIITFYMKKKGKIWMRVYPMFPFTKKPLEVRMGKGKGAVKGWEAEVYPGQVLYEIISTDNRLALNALEQALKRLQLEGRIIYKEPKLSI